MKEIENYYTDIPITNKELQELLSTFPDDYRIVIHQETSVKEKGVIAVKCKNNKTILLRDCYKL